MVVTYKFVGDDDDEAETFLLGAREIEDAAADLKVYSPQSPIGAAILGHKQGDTAPYEVNGKSLEVEILKAVPYTGYGHSITR